MRASVLFVCVLVAAALACPLKKHEDKCSCRPKIFPLQWKIKTFNDQYATIAFQGGWYLQMATPTCIDGATPLKTGLFYNVFPSVCNRVLFYDDTPTIKSDFNLNYIMLDSSFNLVTQTIDYSQSVFRPAYPNTNLALFNIGAQPTYQTPIQEKNPITDAELIQYKLDSYYQRSYTIAIVGSDCEWLEYMVFVVLNEYENLLNSGPDDHILWMFTRSKNPDYTTYKKAFDDIRASGLNPYHMVSVDQSIDLSTVPTVTKEDIEGVVKKTTTQTEESKSSTSDGTVTSSSKKTTVEETTTCVSTVDFKPNPTFSIPYKYENFEWSGKVKVLRDLTLQQYASALTGKFYLSATTPIYSDENGKPGLLNSVFPYTSPQVIIEGTDSTAWKYKEQYMMVERSINAITGQVVITRNLIQLACDDGSMPYASILLYTEGYSEKTIEEVTPFSYDKVTVKTTDLLYKQKFILGITAFQPNKYLMLYMYNQLTNKLNPKYPVNPFYVFTKDRILTKSVTDDITQEIIRSGVQPKNLVHMDHTKTIDDEYKFEKSFFHPAYSPSTPTYPYGKPTNPSINGLLPPNYPRSINPNSPDGLGPIPYPRESPNGISPLLPPDFCPSTIPPTWKVKHFNSQQATIAFQGTWILQLATPTKMNGLNPLKTGLFADLFPCTKQRSIFLDTTPNDQFDFNTNYYWLDSSFNVVTQQVETVQGLFKAAYPSTDIAMFNICVPSYYSQPITEIKPVEDKYEVKYTLNDIYKRQFTAAVVGCDDDWAEYMVFAIANQYDNLYSRPNDYIVWVFTRSENPDYSTYKKACDDITASGLYPYGLMSVDQSIDLKSIPTVTEDDINGTVKTTTVKTTEEEKEEKCTSSNGISSSTSSSSTKKTTVETTSVASPFDIVVRPDYVSPYQLDVFKYSNGIKIIKNLSPTDVRRCFSGKYYVQMALPITCDDNGKAGIVNTLFPSVSLYVQFEEFDETEWIYSKQYMMLDGGLNVVTGQVDKTRTIIQTAYDSETCQFDTFVFYTEGYYTKTVEEINPYVYDDVIVKSPGELYRNKYVVSIAAYKPDSFVALYVHNQFKNIINTKQSKNQMYILARNRILTKEEIDEITQSVAYTGYNVSDLIYIDQTKIIDAELKLESSYFQIITESSSSSSSLSSSIQSSSVSVIEESSSSSSKVEIISS